jgi:hypothetical protein
VPGPDQGPSWEYFRTEFEKLSDEDDRNGVMGRRSLHAMGDHSKFGFGVWTLGGGPRSPEYFHRRFELVATKAGNFLGAPRNVSGRDFWVHKLFEYLRANESRYMDTTGTIVNVCEASAMYCAHLQIQAMEAHLHPYLIAPQVTYSNLAENSVDEIRERLSPKARDRISRAHIEAERPVLEAEAMIENHDFSRDGIDPAEGPRIKARLQKARLALAVYRSEYSKLGITDEEYRKCMDSEIGAASNSLGLSTSQRRLLENEFCFPEQLTAKDIPGEDLAERLRALEAQFERIKG